MRVLTMVAAVACLLEGRLWAQDNAELLNRLRAMDERIKALEAQVTDLKGQQAALTAAVQSSAPPAAPAAPQAVAPAAPGAVPPETMAGQGPVTAPPQLGGAGGAAAKVLNPDIRAGGGERHQRALLGLSVLCLVRLRGDVFGGDRGRAPGVLLPDRPLGGGHAVLG